jgi:hypothetical protein
MYYFLCWIDACDATLVTFIIRISKNYAILVSAADWSEQNNLTVQAYQEEIIMINHAPAEVFPDKGTIYYNMKGEEMHRFWVFDCISLLDKDT